VTPVRITGTDQERSWRAGTFPQVDRVQPGLWSIPVPIPRNPLRYVIVYAFELRDGVAIIDTGWSTEEAWQALRDGLRVAGYDIADVRCALITHIHPDHYGLAGRLRDESGAWVALHPADAELLPQRYGVDIDTLIERMRLLMEECGVPESVRDELTTASMGIREFVALAEPDVLLEDGARIDLPGWQLRALHTPGHSPGHCCFHETERRLLISGDHILPRISPNIAVHAQQQDNPLAAFLESLRRVRGLDVDDVLPAHQWRFSGLTDRVDELVSHHRARLDETERVVVELGDPTCWDVTQRMTWSRPWPEVTGHMRRAAVGETLAHLTLLESQRRVRRDPDASPQRWEATAPSVRS
jgi:glyoxylase-like metal-dependent hydrolase (beta-lactamase superfamily II)